MDINEARKRLPILASLDDQSFVDVVHKKYYADMDKAEFSKWLGVKPTEAPAPERSTMRAVGDLATQFGGGVVSGVRMMTDMFGADNRVSQGLRSAEEALQSLQSAAAQQDQQKVAAIMQEAEGKGWGEQIALGLKAAMVAPGAMMAQSLGTAVPTLATSLIPGVGPAAVAARMGAGAAVGAAQGAGNIKGVIYEDVKRELAKANPGMSAQEIEARAVEAQSFAGENAGQIALGGALGVAAGTTGMERALSGLRNGVTKAPAGVMTRALAGGTAEAVPEFAQGGQEKYASNVAQAGQGLNVDPWSGVVAQGTMEAAAGFAPGAISGIPAPKVATTPGQDVANTIRAENMVPESGPLGRAVNAGTEAKAQQAEAQIDASLQPNPPAVSMTDMLAPQADPVVNESLTAAAPAADQLPDATKMVPDQLAQDLNMVPPGVDPATGEVIQPAPQPDPLDFTGKTDAELQQARKSAQSPAIRNAIAKELQARRAAATPVDQPAADKPATLPTNLASAKERYNYGQKGFDLAFDNDIDRAAYITALTKPDGKRSAKDADYLKFAMDATGMTEADVRAHGQKVKDSIKAQAKGADPGKMTVPKLFGADVTLTNEGKTAAPITSETGKPAEAAQSTVKTNKNGEVSKVYGGYKDKDGVETTLTIVRHPDGSVFRVFSKAKDGARVEHSASYGPAVTDDQIVQMVAEPSDWTKDETATPAKAAPVQAPAVTRKNAIKTASDAAAKAIAGGASDADANRAATDALISQMSGNPDISIAVDAPAAVAMAKKAAPAPVTQPATSGVPEAGAGGSQPPQAAPQTVKSILDDYSFGYEKGSPAAKQARENFEKKQAELEKKLGSVVVKDGKVYVRERAKNGYGTAATETTIDSFEGVLGAPRAMAAIEKAKKAGKSIEGLVEGNSAPSEAESQWTRSTTNDRIAIARAGGIALKPAENVAKKAWGDLAPEAQEKLVRGIAKQTGRTEQTETTSGADDTAKAIHASIADRAKATNRKYYDEQIAKGRMTKDEAERRAAADDKTWRDTPISDRTQAIAKAIEQKDPTVLVGAWAKEGQGVFGVEGSIDAFRKLTGINLKRMNSADRAKAIFDWAGWTEDQVRADVEQRRAAKKEALARYEEKKAKEDAEGTDRLASNTELTTQGKDGKTTVKAYIDGLVERGFTNIGSKKVGAITKTFLFNPKTDSGYPLQKGILSEYAILAAKRYADNEAAKTAGEDTQAAPKNTEAADTTDKPVDSAPQNEQVEKPPTLQELRDKVDEVPPLTNEHLQAIRELKNAAVADAEAEIEAGRAPVYKSSTGVTSVITPSAKKSGMFQVTRYTSNGVFGDSQYKSVRDAVIEDQLHMVDRLEPQQADALMGKFVEAEAEFQAKKNATNSTKENADDWMGELFGGESQAAEPDKAKKTTPDRDKSRLASVLATAKSEAEASLADWQGRSYKDNSKQVNFEGDGPTRNESMSISAINEGRKRKAIEALTQEVKAIEKLEQMLGDEKSSDRLLDMLDSTMEQAEKDIANGTAIIGKTPAEAFEYAILQSLDIKPAQGAYSSNKVSKALLGYLNGAANSADTNAAAPPDDVVEIKDKFGRKHSVRQSDLDGKEDRIPTVRSNGEVVAGEEIPRSIIEVESSAADQPTETPKLTQAQAADLMAWESLGTKDGVTKHILTFYESQADKDANRGRMTVATVTKGDRSATAWMVDGDDQTFGPLSLAKKRGMEVGMAKAVADGFVEQAEQTAQEAAPAKAKKKSQTAKQKREALESHFRPGNVIQSDYWKEFDRVVEFDWNGGNWSVTVEKVVKDGDGWKATEGKRNHSTTPDSRDKVVFEAPAPAEPIAPSSDAKPASKTPTYDAHNDLIQQVVAGNATPEQFKASFESVLANADAIKAELTTKTKAELLRDGGAWVQMRYGNENKADIVDALYRSMVGDYALNQSIQYSMGKGAYEAAVRRFVEATDEQRLADFAKERAAAIEEIKAKRAAKAAALENPQTLDDYRGLMTTKMRAGMTRKEAYLDLTAEQRVTFDELEAESTREARETRKRTNKTQVQAAGQTTGGEIVATKHTREGYDLFVVKLADRVSREDYATLLGSAKKMGGWYSSFRGNGAIPGFQFKDKANAEAFLKLAAGDTTEAQAQVEQRRDAFEDDRSQTAAERLTTMADKLEESADESLNADRKTNTARRARFANAAEAAARAEKAMAKTMRNIAQAITDGKAKFLDAVRTKTQVQMLADIVRTAKDSELRAKYPAYADMEKRRGEPPTVETADFAEFPTFTAFRSDLASLGRQLLEVDGTKKLGQQLMNVADDVSDAYLEFAKEPANLVRLSTFSMRRGETVSSAAFASRDLAEKAIRRSNLTGKAIVLPLKRGDNRIIMSPSEAINAGVWKGDGDKRITLTKEAGQLLVQAIGRRANKQNRLSVPWQFESADTKLKALARMGIETPAEFRSAVREFIGLREQAQEADRVKMLERAMVGRKADGLDFFPTPQEAADAMVEAAEITPDMAVLEPSAGMGHLADRIRAAGAEPDVIEISAERRELLQEKGYNTQDVDDFMDLKPRQFYTFGDVFRAPDGKEGVMRGLGGMGSDRVRLQDESGTVIGYYNRSELTGIRQGGTDSGYDRIIMNPPFSDRRDAAHVMHAYDLLKPGGRIVAIMGEGVFFGQDKKAEEFRAWFEERGGTSEKLAEGTFMDPSLPVTTGVNARMVVIDKPASAPMFSRSPATQQAYEARIDGLFSGEKAKTGTKILDSSDVMGLLGYPKLPLVLNERHLIDGLTTHPEVTAEAWKRVPEWIENPVAVYKSLDGKNPQRVVLLAPELLAGKPVVMVIEPSPGVVGARTEKPSQEQLLVTVFAKTTGYVPLGNAAMQGKLLYLQKEMAPAISGSEGVQFPKHGHLSAGREKILTEKNLAGYRKKQDPAMSLGTGRGIEVETAQGVVDGIASRWTNAPEIVVVADLQDTKVPERVRLYDAEQRSQGASGEPEGFWYGGKAYIVAAAINTPQDVARVLFHETLGHYGLRGTFGEGLTPILKQLAAMRRPLVAAKAEQYGLDMGKESDRLQAAEEVLAEMAQSKPEMGYVKRAIAAIRAFLRKNVPGFQKMALTDADIIAQYILPARAFVERGPGGGGPKGGLAFSRSTTTDGNGNTRTTGTMGATELAGQVRDKLNETFNHPGKLSWWHKTVGSQYNLAERSPAFKKVFDAAQDFINDVSYYATEAANMAPKILPKLETLRDLTKTAISAADNKAVAAPVFEGTLSWARDADGKAIRIEALEKRYENLTDDEKAQMLLRKNVVSEAQLKAWKASKLDVYQGAIRNRFESTFLKAGVRWTDAELKSIFKLTDDQVELYKEFRATTDTSLDNMAKAQMLREAGKDVADMRDAVMEAPDVDTAAMMLREVLLDMANDNPDRADILKDAAAGVLDTAAKINELKKQGYAPLSRFGRFTVDVVVDGQREYFGLFESEGEANRMAAKMRAEFGAENVAQGTMSQKEFELFQGITPESLELFGNMMGLDSTGNEAQDKAFQTYLKLTKNNRSAMKRLIHRQGIAGYSEDVGRVLAAFVYANARQTSAALHIGQMDEAITAIPKGEGELKDHALELAKYIKEPREEAAAVRGLLFAQYLGGSVASAMVNFTQPLTVSIPYLSQFGGLAKAGKAWAQAVKDMSKGTKLEPGLERALKDAEESGVVSPQEVHQLMAQARGASTLQSGDGTKLGDAKAKVANGWTRTALAWGKLFGYAEQVNRRSTFIAAYRLAVDQKIPNPGAFAEKAVNETQFVNNKANKMKFGRGAIGATLMTFKSYSIHWLELMHRLSTQDGKDGKMAAAYMLGALFLVAGAGGLPFAGDAEDLIDAIAQKMGYNFSTKKAKQEFLESVFGKAGAQFVDRGLTGLPGVPIDVSGRMGMSNLIPGTGLLLEKRDSSRDLMELAGPAGDMAKRFFEAVGLLAKGEVGKAVETAAPKAVGNMIKGADMLDKGMYRDTKGAKVIDTTTGEAVAKMIGFQPSSVAQVQESNYINQRAKDFYSLKTQEIRAKWAMGIFENDPDKVAEARKMMEEWNSDNPDQRMTANMPAIVKKVREMRKDKAQRIADTAPKAMRAQMREDAKELANR